jgi:hypothetical protein
MGRGEPSQEGQFPENTLIRDTVGYYPLRSLDTREVPVREECLVAQSKEGFFVLRYESPTSSFDRWRPAFQHVIDNFEVVP